jgi:meiotic recombination protein SPO11
VPTRDVSPRMTDDLECVDFAPPRSPATLEHDGGRFFDDDSQDFANFVGDGDDEDEDDVFDTVFSAQTRMRARVLERIELLACKFAQDALRAGDGASGGMPVVRGDRLSRSNRRYENGEAIDEDDPSDSDENDDIGGKRNDESRTSCVVARFTGDGNAYERFWDVLSVLANALRRTDCESGMSLRELYYVMNSRGRRGGSQTRVTEHQIAATIRKISQALGAPRIALGIVAASKGQVAGRCHIETASGARFDCTACGNDGWAITGDLFELDATKIHSDAAYVIVVEKDAVFNRLCAERVFEKLPCVLVTAKGFPDLATRKFLHLLRRALEDNDRGNEAQFFGLVDWNPSGCWILSTYTVGNSSSAMDVSEYVTPLKWIGLRSQDLYLIPECAFQALSSRDEAMINNALNETAATHPLRPFASELEVMQARGQKAEIEALYANDDISFLLTDFVSSKIAAFEEE